MKYLTIFAFLLIPTLALAANGVYTPLVGIPGVEPGSNSSFDDYINALYALSISIAALLAVIKIIIAGVKWMMTDVVTSKSDAKNDIKGALIGLLIVLGAVLILTVINPNLTKVNLVLDSIKQTPPTYTPSNGSTKFDCTDLGARNGWNCNKAEDKCKALGDNVQTVQSADRKTVTCIPRSGTVLIDCRCYGNCEADNKVYTCGEAMIECKDQKGVFDQWGPSTAQLTCHVP